MSTPHFVYELLAEDGSHLYVGVSVDIGRRLSQHRPKAWFPDVASIQVQRYADATSGYAAEAALIRLHQPAHNDAMTADPRVKRLPCRTCRAGAHSSCVRVNTRGQACECSVCEAAASQRGSVVAGNALRAMKVGPVSGEVA